MWLDLGKWSKFHIRNFEIKQNKLRECFEFYTRDTSVYHHLDHLPYLLLLVEFPPSKMINLASWMSEIVLVSQVLTKGVEREGDGVGKRLTYRPWLKPRNKITCSCAGFLVGKINTENIQPSNHPSQVHHKARKCNWSLSYHIL